MPERLLGPKVVRGTICRDRWRVDLLIVSPDRVPEGGAAHLLLDVRWRAQEEELPERPEDARPVTLTLRKRSEASTGSVLFDGEERTASRSFAGDTRRLLTLHGESATTGAEPDVLLEVRVEDELEDSFPLSVGALPTTLAILGGEGSAPPQRGIVEGRPVHLRAATADPPLPGSFRWYSIAPDVLELRGDAAGESAEVLFRPQSTAPPAVGVFFTPEDGGPGLLAVHEFTPSLGLSYRGRVLDQVGRPAGGVSVSARSPDGALLVRTTTLETGVFALSFESRDEWLLVLEAGESRAAFPQRVAPEDLVEPRDLGEHRIRLPLALDGSLGTDGDNLPLDVLRVQDHLLHLGRLTAADAAAEPVDPRAAAPVDLFGIPRLFGALDTHLRLSVGVDLSLLRPGDPVLAAMTASPPFPVVRLGLTQPVGELPGAGAPAPAMNAPAEVRAVQERLFQLGFLAEPDYRAERQDPAPPPPVAPVDPATIPRTVAAIRRFDSLVAQGSLRAVVPGRRTAQLLEEPYLFGLLPLRLRGTVGAGGENRPADVRAVQDRLLRLGLLAPPRHQAEAVAVPDPDRDPPPAPVAEAAVGDTIAAISRFRETRLGVPAPAPGIVEVENPEAARLAHPPRVALSGAVGEPAGGTAPPNHAADVRALQDRLLLLGLLAGPDHQRERVNPAHPGPVAPGGLGATLGALRTFRQRLLGAPPTAAGAPPPPVQVGPGDLPPALSLTGAVGAGKANARADVRAVQDRLHALRFLGDTDHAREQVDPARTGPVNEAALQRTFEAVSRFREQVLRHPAAAAGEPWTAQGVVEPDDDTHRLLSNPLFGGPDPVALTGPVGFMGWNRPADVRPVQDRLLRLRVLAAASHTAEAADPARSAPVAESALAATLAAIRRFQESFLGVPPPAVGRIEPQHPTVAALGNPLFALTRWLELTGSVGAGGDNAPAEVRAVQDRLRDLRWLPEGEHRDEAVALPGAGAVADGRIPRTIAAIRSFQERAAELPAPAAGLLEPQSLTHRMLAKPFLPPPAALGLAGSVGAQPRRNPARNRAPDVLRVQERLHRLGYLDTADYVAERAVATAAGAGAVPEANVPRTVAAIRAFQRTASGGTDGIVGAGGMTERVLNDPTFTTPTITNPHTDLRSAGPAMPAFIHAVQQIIIAIEAHEAGGSTGEVPAILRNGSQTPASFGKAQMIGGTATGTLDNNAPLAGFYDLAAADVQALRDVAGDTATRYNAIFALVPAGTTEAQLLVLIRNYVTANLAAFRAETGLGEDDVARMFRTAQFRRHTAGRVEADAPHLMNAATHPDEAANIAALGLRNGDVRAYLRNHRIHGEHRAGFVTRALFHSRWGQVLHDAMTDDSGFKMGRYLIRDNYNSVTAAAAAAGVALTPRQHAEITARMHNGMSGLTLAQAVANPALAVNGYVNNVMAHWVP